MNEDVGETDPHTTGKRSVDAGGIHLFLSGTGTSTPLTYVMRDAEIGVPIMVNSLALRPSAAIARSVLPVEMQNGGIECVEKLR